MKSNAYLIQRRKTLTTTNPIEVKCLYCKKVFLTKLIKLKNGRGKFCSITCRSLGSLPKGNKHPFWKGGVTSINQKIRQSIEFRLWREAVFARDNWTCQECNKKGVILNAHHVKPFAKFPKLRFAIDNGITLCKNCHYQKPKGRKINVLFK